MRISILLILALVAAACGSAAKPATPTSPSQPPTGGGALSTPVCVLDATVNLPISGITPTVAGRSMALTNANGDSLVSADTAGQYTVTFSSAAIATRTTSIRVPADEIDVHVIPANFDLAAFDQMFRPGSRLQRWTSAPPLVVLTRAVQYEGNYANNPLVLDDQMSDTDRQALVNDLSDGFQTLTDHRLGGFSSVTFESPTPGTRVDVMRTGSIVVARSKGLTAGSTYWGFGRWATTSSGAVVGGNVMIDADFEGPSSSYPQYRRCLHIHELGHALGYNHVTSRASVMNSSARLEPNAWDLQAVHIAFLRPPGNTAPDTDPSGFSLNLRTGAVTWSPPIF